MKIRFLFSPIASGIVSALAAKYIFPENLGAALFMFIIFGIIVFAAIAIDVFLILEDDE